MQSAGSALLEVIAALAILAVGGLAASTLIATAAHSLTERNNIEAELREANRFMNAVVLWPREDMDRRLGIRRQGEWLLLIRKSGGTLYHIEVLRTDSTPLLQTAAYRAR